MTQDLLFEFNALRRQTFHVFEKPDGIDRDAIRELRQKLGSRPGMSELECVRHLMRDLDSFLLGERFSLGETLKYFNAPRDNMLVSILHAPYARQLRLEYLKFHTLEADSALLKYKTNVMPIVVDESTEGLLPAHTVAIFPENHVGAGQEPDDKIYYLINKFAARHYNLTQRIIEHLTAEDSFSAIRGATYEETEKATVYWVWLHEYNHQKTGSLTIPAYLKLKSSRALAGLEELRVDIGGMLILLDDPQQFDCSRECLFEFILAERLLRYGVDGVAFDAQGLPVPSYDALSSYMFFNLLRQHGALEVIDGKISLRANLIDALRSILKRIETIEALIHQLPVEKVKVELLDFVAYALEVPTLTNSYAHPQYDRMRETLRSMGVQIAMA